LNGNIADAKTVDVENIESYRLPIGKECSIMSHFSRDCALQILSPSL